MQVLVQLSTLEADLVRAERAVTRAQHALTHAQEQLEYVKARNDQILAEHPKPPPPVYTREDHQTTLVITAHALGYSHINTIKAVREFGYLGLKEAKDLCESPLPIRVRMSTTHKIAADPCLRAFNDLTRAGCVVEWAD